MPDIIESMKQAGRSLGQFAAIATGIVALTFFITETRITENERQALLSSLHELIPEDRHDNDLYSDTLLLDESSLNYKNKPITVYRARLNNAPTAAIFSVTAPDGYTGAIKLLVAININNAIEGVRVISHKETPGLGDAIDIEKSDWITNFDGSTLSYPFPNRWRVKKPDGTFYQPSDNATTPYDMEDGSSFSASSPYQWPAEKNGGNFDPLTDSTTPRTTAEGGWFSNSERDPWRVKKDGGDFDQLTGATITPRAIVKITKKTLQYFEANHNVVFAKMNETQSPNKIEKNSLTKNEAQIEIKSEITDTETHKTPMADK